jgi:hypothetical protein
VLVELRVTNQQHGSPLDAELALYSEHRGRSAQQEAGGDQSGGTDAAIGLPALWNGNTAVQITSVRAERVSRQYAGENKQGGEARCGEARCREVWRGEVWRGEVWRGEVWRGEVWRGEV